MLSAANHFDHIGSRDIVDIRFLRKQEDRLYCVRYMLQHGIEFGADTEERRFLEWLDTKEATTWVQEVLKFEVKGYARRASLTW